MSVGESVVRMWVKLVGAAKLDMPAGKASHVTHSLIEGR